MENEEETGQQRVGLEYIYLCLGRRVKKSIEYSESALCKISSSAENNKSYISKFRDKSMSRTFTNTIKMANVRGIKKREENAHVKSR